MGRKLYQRSGGQGLLLNRPSRSSGVVVDEVHQGLSVRHSQRGDRWERLTDSSPSLETFTSLLAVSAPAQAEVLPVRT